MRMKKNKKIMTRFAPTPSGYLHLGNLYNLLLVERLAARIGADLVLRVDDLDQERYRAEYAEDIFRVMRWLGVDWTAGPRSIAELESTYSQNLRLGRYTSAMDLLRPHVFACACSRSDVAAASGDGGYPGTCRDAGLALDTPGAAWRLRLDGPPDERDPVVRRKDGRPAYHLASVVDDVDMGITHVMRGEDLRASTHIQQAVARALGFIAFERIVFIHHPLLTAPDGEKLSKSAGAQAQSLLETPGLTPEAVRAGFEAWRASAVSASE